MVQPCKKIDMAKITLAIRVLLMEKLDTYIIEKKFKNYKEFLSSLFHNVPYRYRTRQFHNRHYKFRKILLPKLSIRLNKTGMSNKLEYLLVTRLPVP